MTVFDEPATTGARPPAVRIGLRVVGVAVFVFYLVRTGALWPFGVVPAVIVACLVCWLVWMLAGDKMSGTTVLALVGAPTIAGSIIGAVPGRFALAIVFAIGGIIGIIASAKIGVHIGIGVAAVCLLAFEITAIVRAENLADWAWTTFGLLLAAGMGYGRRQSRLAAERTRELITAQQQLLAQAETLRAEQARTAALAERGRIARDLHDVLAHALGGLVVQLDAAEGLLSVNRDVDGASARLRSARTLAVEGLDDARQAVTALRSDTPMLAAALQSMVDGYDAGHAEFNGPHEVDLPQDLTASLVAVVREALNNSRKHAAGAAVTVWLRLDEESVRIDVVNAKGTASELAATGAGAGIAGMRERMDAVGGTLRAGPADGTTWRVSARAPLPQPAERRGDRGDGAGRARVAGES